MVAADLTRPARTFGSVEHDVLFGRGGQLFLARGGHDVLEFATGVRPIPPDSVRIFRENLRARSRRAAAAGVRYAHLICPDKQSVLRDDYVTNDPICIGQHHLAVSPDIAGHTVYPLDLLRQAGSSSFLRTDTHMSDRGTILAVCALVEHLTGQDQSDTQARMLHALRIQRRIVGDLGGKLTPTESSLELFAEPFWQTRRFKNDMEGGNNGIVDIYCTAEAKYPERVLMFGDSFGREAARFLSCFFTDVIFLRTPYFHPDIFDSVRPSILLTETVERYLTDCLSDDQRPSFFMYPYLNGCPYQPTEEFARAFSAILTGRRPSL